MFVITSLRGDTLFQDKQVHMSLNMGHGLFERSVCFGPRPSNELLSAFGLSCDGEMQTAGCAHQHATTKRKQAHCDDFKYMQRMEFLALLAALLGSMLSSASQAQNMSKRALLGFMACLATLVAFSTASAVIVRLNQSDMVDFDGTEDSWQCTEVFGIEVCHGYGVSFILQGLALGMLSTALMVGLMSTLADYCRALRGDLQEEEVVMDIANAREPLIGVHSRRGYVIARPLVVTPLSTLIGGGEQQQQENTQ